MPHTPKDLLAHNAYPGRGLVLGMTADATRTAAAYFIMGRSENSRNRVFVETDDGIRTEAHDAAKLRDPSLILYHPVRVVGDTLVVTNGDQTDTIRDALQAGLTPESALATREYEPDAPNFTPRISGLLHANGDYVLSILKRAEAGGGCLRQYFHYPAHAGTGHLLHTYRQDGDPLPSFAGEPHAVAIANDMDAFAAQLWDALDRDNRISLYVRFADLRGGGARHIIFNQRTEGGRL